MITYISSSRTIYWLSIHFPFTKPLIYIPLFQNLWHLLSSLPSGISTNPVSHPPPPPSPSSISINPDVFLAQLTVKIEQFSGSVTTIMDTLNKIDQGIGEMFRHIVPPKEDGTMVLHQNISSLRSLFQGFNTLIMGFKIPTSIDHCATLLLQILDIQVTYSIHLFSQHNNFFQFILTPYFFSAPTFPS